MGRYQSGQLGQTVNLLANAFVGSNPALPTSNGVLTVKLKMGRMSLRISLDDIRRE